MTTIQRYLESPEVKGLAKSTRDLYGYALDHMDRYIRSRPTRYYGSDCVSNFDIQEFAIYLENENLSGKSIQQYLTCTKIFLKWTGHPTEFTYKISNKLRQENKLKHLERWFTEDDIGKCLAYCFNNGEALAYQTVVRLLVETGARVREVSTIRADDVHLEDRYLFVHGKTEPRPVIFSDETAALLEQLLNGAMPLAKDRKIFPNVAKIKSAVTSMLGNLCLKNGKDGRGPHTFRHYTATYLFYAGNMRIEDLAFLLGDKVDTIRERYLHPTPKMIRDRVQAAWKNEKKVARDCNLPN